MPQTPREPQPAPPGYVWIDEAANRLRLSKQTLYNYKHLGIGPKPEKYRRRLVYRIEELDAWNREQMSPELAAALQHESRPPEPRIARPSRRHTARAAA